MNEQKQNNNNNLDDLTVAGDEETQIKGGPTPKSKRILLLKSSVAEQNSITGDLEPTDEVKGGGWGYGESTIKLNHSQTMTKVAGDEDKTQTAKLADLAEPEDLEPDGDVVSSATTVIKPKRPVLTMDESVSLLESGAAACSPPRVLFNPIIRKKIMAARISIPTTAQLPADAKTTFLDLAPPHWAARGLAWAMFAIFALGVIASVAITLPEKVSAQFTLTPVRGADPVKATRGGVVAQVLVSESQTVNTGDLIVTLRSETAGERAAELQTIQTQLAGNGESFVNTRMKYDAERMSSGQEIRKLRGRVEHLDSLIGHKRRQLELIRQMADSYEKLYREGLASLAQYSAKQIEVSELVSEVERLVAEQRDARIEVEKLKLVETGRQTDFREYERKSKENAQTQEIRATAIKSGLVNTDGDQVRLVAPCSGTILKLRVKDSGAVVSEGETVAELACGGEQLVAELAVPESGVGKLKLDQGVKLKFDAFPYQRYGVKRGKLSWMSPAKGDGETAQSFKARVELIEKEITVKGQPRPLAAGMSGVAEIVVGKRALISYVIEPIRQLRENMSDAP